MRALPLALARSVRSESDGTRCWRPASWPSSMRVAMSRSAGAPSICNAAMRNSLTVNASGSRSVCGSTAGVLAVAAPTCTCSTLAPSITNPNHAPSCGRQAQRASCQASLSSTINRGPARTSTRCALKAPPNKRPVGCVAVTSGTRANSQALPVSLPTASHNAAHSSNNRPNSAISTLRSMRRGAGGVGGAAALSTIRTRCPPRSANASAALHRHTPRRRAAAPPGCASARRRPRPRPA
jgi:hypothetical protein